MDKVEVTCNFFFDDLHTNRKNLFQKALQNTLTGRVLYIMHDELEELPQMSQELTVLSRQYMKMISFMYVKTLQSLIETLASLPVWQSVSRTIILDDISNYCDQNHLHTACGVVALLIDSARSCSASLKEPCSVYVSATRGVVDENYCMVLRELYFDYYSDSDMTS